MQNTQFQLNNIALGYQFKGVGILFETKSRSGRALIMESDRNAAILAEIFADSDSEMEIDTENDETSDDESSNDGDKAASSGTASVFAPVDHDEVQVGLVAECFHCVHVL